MTNNINAIENQEESEETQLERFIDSKLYGIYTSMPGIVKSYDDNSGMADILPIHKEGFQDLKGNEIIQERPVIPNVPIMKFNTGGFFESFPIEIDTPVLIFFSSRSIDDYLYTDGKEPLTADDGRKHDINDAFAIPMIITFKNSIPAVGKNYVVGKKDLSSYFKIKENSDVEIKGNAKVSLTTSRVNLGSESANTALAKGNKTDDNFSKIFQWITTATPFLTALGMAQLPPTFDGTSSGKVFSND